MALTLEPILRSVDIDPMGVLVIRHAYIREHEDSGRHSIHVDSTDDEILQYTREQSMDPRRFPAIPPRIWIVFIRAGGTGHGCGACWRTAGRSRTTAHSGRST